MDTSSALRELEEASSLTLMKLAGPLFAAHDPEGIPTNTRTSNASSTSSDTTRNASVLRADLQHYQELFSKLRFSYVEQVTKEKFLRAVTADAPEFVDEQENVALQEKIKEDKSVLSEKKDELNGMIQDLDAQCRELARRHHEIEMSKIRLATLPQEIQHLKATVAQLKASQELESDNPDLRLPLQSTLALLSRRKNDSAEIDAKLAELRAYLPQKEQEVRNLEEELQPLQRRKEDAVAQARQMRKRKQGGTAGDVVEEEARWLRAADRGLRSMLQV